MDIYMCPWTPLGGLHLGNFFSPQMGLHPQRKCGTPCCEVFFPLTAWVHHWTGGWYSLTVTRVFSGAGHGQHFSVLIFYLSLFSLPHLTNVSVVPHLSLLPDYFFIYCLKKLLYNTMYRHCLLAFFYFLLHFSIHFSIDVCYNLTSQ